LREYERCANTHRFDEVAPLIAADAIFWFSDGSYQGKEAIRQAFEATFDLIREERYTLEQLHWLVEEEHIAVCLYDFHWQGLVNGQPARGSGRGTSVLRQEEGHWYVVHEHLSRLPG
jgi:ketosteroid isomerase-like protein